MNDELHVGDRVHHPVRGLGTVTREWKSADQEVDAVSVNFDDEPNRLFIFGADHVCKVAA